MDWGCPLNTTSILRGLRGHTLPTPIIHIGSFQTENSVGRLLYGWMGVGVPIGINGEAEYGGDIHRYLQYILCSFIVICLQCLYLEYGRYSKKE